MAAYRLQELGSSALFLFLLLVLFLFSGDESFVVER